jgi:hypothetical protein
MTDVFFSVDLAIATYRRAVGTTIPEMTKVASGRKREEIQKVPACVERPGRGRSHPGRFPIRGARTLRLELIVVLTS